MFNGDAKKKTAALNRWSDPETRAKLIEGMRAKKSSRNNEICKLALSKTPVKDIALIFNISTQLVNRILKNNKIKPVRTRSKRISQNTIRNNKIKIEFEECGNLDLVAKRNNLSVSRLRQILKDEGVKFARKSWNKNSGKIESICQLPTPL